MTTTRVTIRKPEDPFASAINARRGLYAKKWHAEHEGPVPEQQTRAPGDMSLGEIADALLDLSDAARKIGGGA